MRSIRVNDDVTVLNDYLEVPGLGFLAVNAFVLHAEQPVVIDTGLGLPDRDFLEHLGSVLDPADVRWIWLTHPDRDHTGALFELLEVAPDARLITTFAGAGIMSAECPLPMGRLYFLNPGESLDVGDRTLTAFRPPLFDNPATVGFFDDSSGSCFSSDCFGAPLASAEHASAVDVRHVAPDELAERQRLWASVDSPWVSTADPVKFGRTVDPLAAFGPSAIFSTHLPPAIDRTAQLLATIRTAPSIDPFIGPDQHALEQILRQFEPAV
ncbi:MAG: MBL fold metallo-hydrolase [Actinomycetota bacterium]|nr:MBL fold metallo-hydrolase [Actinomycetota bacterium]